uniref:Uncharacterized protein LOC108043913 n=1 Tax=Drosophila rhopaloa TaxID=1041015 RepID=A0A6P4EYU4_DRORH
CSISVLSFPQSPADDEQMQNDEDFDYNGVDQSAPSPQTKSPRPITSEKVNKTVTVNGIRGQDVVLKCDVGTNLDAPNVVVLWSFGVHIISNGKNVVQPNYALNENYDLTIVKASSQEAGDYSCKVLPIESVVNTKVIIVDQSLDAIAPESSVSAAGSLSSFLGYTLLGSALLLLGMGKH